MAELLRWLFIVMGTAVIVLLVKLVVRRARALDQRIEEYHKEQEEHPEDPYAALAELLAEQRRGREKRK